MAIVAALGLAFNLSAKNEDNGFGLKLNVGIAGGAYTKEYTVSGYGISYSSSVDMDRSGIGGGLALDNRWYIKPQPKWGIAVDARWLDFQYSACSLDDDDNVDINSIEAGILGVGPLFTYYLNDDMAIDAYYNIVPTLAVAASSSDDDNSDDMTYLGFGVAHHVGAAFRYKVFQGGVEYRLGKINVENTDDDWDDDMDAPMNQFRIFVGFKF